MIRKSQQGSGLFIVLVILGIVGLMGVIGILVWQKAETSTTKSTNNTSQSSSSSTSSTPSSLLYAKYQSALGGFTMYYPKGWLVTGYAAGAQVQTLSGNEDHLHIQIASDTNKVDNFGGDFYITNDAPGDTAWPLYPNGTVVQTLSNGIGVWEDNQTQTLQTGRADNTCPSIRIASNDAFGFQLKNGKYLSFTGSFCWAPDYKTSLSYGQQVASDEFKEVVTMFKTIQQN